MTTSGTTAFTLDVDEIVREAFEMAGGQPVLGEEARSARRSLNLLLTEWQNRNIHLWKVNEYSVTVQSSVQTYSLSSTDMDLVELLLSDSSTTDLPMERKSREEFFRIPNRLSDYGSPSQYTVIRSRTSTSFSLWPIPDNNTDVLRYLAISRMEDVTRMAENVDIPHRFMPALTMGLAYLIAMKRPSVPTEKVNDLKAKYEEQLMWANGEDRERTSLFITPMINSAL